MKQEDKDIKEGRRRVNSYKRGIFTTIAVWLLIMVFIYYFFMSIIVDDGAMYIIALFTLLIISQIWWFLLRNRRKLEGILYSECDAKTSVAAFSLMKENDKNRLLKAQALAMAGEEVFIDVKSVPHNLFNLLLDIYTDICLNTGDMEPFLKAIDDIEEEIKKEYFPKAALKKINKNIEKSKIIVGLCEDKMLREKLMNKELNTAHAYRRILINLILSREAIKQNNLEEAKIRLSFVYDKVPKLDASSKAEQLLKSIQ